MKNKAQRILEYVQGEEEIAWITSKRTEFPLILNVKSHESGVPHINVYDRDMNYLGKIIIPSSKPNSEKDIKILEGNFNNDDKNILLQILLTKVDYNIDRWKLADVAWAAFHGEM